MSGSLTGERLLSDRQAAAIDGLISRIANGLGLSKPDRWAVEAMLKLVALDDQEESLGDRVPRRALRRCRGRADPAQQELGGRQMALHQIWMLVVAVVAAGGGASGIATRKWSKSSGAIAGIGVVLAGSAQAICSRVG